MKNFVDSLKAYKYKSKSNFLTGTKTIHAFKTYNWIGQILLPSFSVTREWIVLFNC